MSAAHHHPLPVRTRLLVLVVLCAVSFASGLVISSIGPTIPDLARRLSSSPGALGALFTALFLGTLVAQSITFLWADRVGLRPVLVAGLLLYGCATISLALSGSMMALMLSAFGMGIGWGFAGLSINVLPTQITARRLSVALNLVNLCYAIGAIGGPLLVAFALRHLYSAGAALQVGGALLLACAAPALVLAPRGAGAASASLPATPQRLHASPMLWTLGVLAFLYVGIENGTGGWTPTYLMRTLALDEASAASHTALFWIALCGGRLLGTVLGLRAGARVLLKWSLAGAVCGSVLALITVGHHRPTLVALIILGAAFGPIYASLVELVTSAFPRRPSAAMSMASALGAVGGMVLPWLQGLSLEWFGGWAMGTVVLAAAIGMAACAALANWFAAKRPGTA
ncbi:MAG: MFS transporter [Luteitalea sp.]|nr:MFS transporter [Luteitalea sp.]